jgi:uncharacterized protein with NRDE domain
LVVVANRDEFYDRPTAALGWWQDHPRVLAGRDLRAGGSWMGVNRQGDFAAVTNYREGVPADSLRSRGALVADFLTGGKPAPDYLDALSATAGDFGGFSLMAGSVNPDDLALYYFSNRAAGFRAIPDGLHTLSNHLLDTPWPKAEFARLKLTHHLKREPLRVEELIDVLAERRPFDDHELPVTGISIEMERTLSPPFIVSEKYGTRCTSVLMVARCGEVVFAEQTFLEGGRKGSLALHEFEL